MPLCGKQIPLPEEWDGMDLVSFCLIPVNEVSIQGPKTLKASKFDQNHNFESFKAIALSYIKSLEFIKQIHQEIQEIDYFWIASSQVVIYHIILFMILIHMSFSLLSMFLYFSESISIRAYAHIYIEEKIKTKATKKRQGHKLYGLVSTPNK